MIERNDAFRFESPPRRPRVTLVLLLAIVLGACTGEEQAGPTTTALRIGVLPDQSADVLRERYEPVLRYFEHAIGRPCELIVPESYESLLARFRRDELDIAYFGALTFVAARELAGAVPLVHREEDRKFVSYYLVPGDSAVESLHDLAGASLAFGSRLSTSGHLMPRYFLQERGIVPEQFFGEIRYTGSHDATARAVRDGEADLGVANAQIIDEMRRDGLLVEGDLRVLEETPPYPDYVWAARQGLPVETRTAVMDAFLALDPWRDDDVGVLRALNARAYLPVTPREHDSISTIVRAMGLIEELR